MTSGDLPNCSVPKYGTEIKLKTIIYHPTIRTGKRGCYAGA
ncbi:MAG: hypothetical protein ACE1YV_04555 [Nitrosopumilaceae archaeon]